MRIDQIYRNKKKYLDLLLLADEQEDMIDQYLENGDMFILLDPDVNCICVITDNGSGELEIKNIAVNPDSQGKGYGRMMIEHIKTEYHDRCRHLIVGTGDSPMTIPFYKKCGFKELYRIENFFTDHYNHPIFEAGTQLVDMVILGWTPQRPKKMSTDSGASSAVCT